MARWRVLALLLCCPPAVSAGAAPDFQHDVLPLLKVRCVRCHGPAKQEGKLSLALPNAVARGGENGPLFSEAWESGLLWQRVTSDEMPPEEPLPDEDKKVLRAWVEAGAPGLPTDFPAQADGEEHWAFQTLTMPALPTVRDESRLRTPIDRFVQNKLEAIGLSVGPEASRETLIRRVALDLTGLPPTPEEIAAFLQDADAQAYEKMVERYLASPRYGERWGKYWLDAAGYADSNGYFNADTDRPLAYRYRDWVIDAINADKPFDQFLREQIAGDELAGYHEGVEVTEPMLPLLTATHFLRNSPDGTDSSDGNDDERRADKYAVLEGALQIMGSSLFGVTVQCARCHDHKFEPFSQHDYYQLQAVLYPAFNVENWKYPRDRHLPAVTSEAWRAWEEKSRGVDEQIVAERNDLDAWVKANRPRGKALFAQDFEDPGEPLAVAWSNAAPGDAAPAGQPAVNLDSAPAPGAQQSEGRLRIVESGDSGDRALSTQATFDWTPNLVGGWIQATFDLVEAGEAPYVGYFLALRDFNDHAESSGGNVLIDGARDGQAAVHVDYPGDDVRSAGKIGASGYEAGKNYGVRVTHREDGKFELAQLVNGELEAETVTLAAEDLPDGGFGFEYCCGRSFTVDNVVIETNDPSTEGIAAEQAFVAEQQSRRQKLDAAIAELESSRGAAPDELAFVTDLAREAPSVPLLERGDYKSPKESLHAQAPAMLSESTNASDLATSAAEERPSTGWRTAFAHWITKPDSRAASLLARVTVNRWWAHHFGTGIVATPENLGYSGALPSHPELLEYLASTFIQNGWSAKALHREILLSAAYRQSSSPTDAGALRDPQALFLSRYPVHRLDAEAIRDGMLAVAGDLDAASGGPYVPTERAEDGDVIVKPDTPGALRRSIYLQQRRTQVLGMLDVFDAPSLVTNCTLRVQTTIPLQSLKLLNSEFVRERASSLAAHSRPTSDSAARVGELYVRVLGRAPSDAEQTAALRFVAEQPHAYPDAENAGELAWVDFCQALLSSNAFLYVE